MFTRFTQFLRNIPVPLALRTCVIASLLLGLSVVSAPAQAAPVINETQWVKGKVGFDQYVIGSYPYNSTYIMKMARIDYRTPSGVTTVPPKVGESFLIHLSTSIVSPVTLNDHYQMRLLLPSGVQLAISTAADFRCYITDTSSNVTRSTATGECARPAKEGTNLRFTPVYLMKGEIAHFFIRVVATKAFSASITADCSKSEVIVTGVCIQMTSTAIVNPIHVSTNPLVSAVALRVTGKSAPSAPRSVKVSPRNKSAVVSWTAPASTGGVAISRYTVTASPGGRTCVTTGARSCTVTGLANRVGYRFTVRARNAIGTSVASAKSSTTIVGTTTSVRAMAASFPSVGNVKVTWSAPASLGSGAVIRYESRGCYFDGAAWTAFGAWGTEGTKRYATDTGLPAGLSIRIQIRAINGSGASAPVQLQFVQGI
ncbi:MAG: fibronectin type III domain-containing protein [Actinomycetes bacterium]